jgi:regulator of nonsense transcripts 1
LDHLLFQHPLQPLCQETIKLHDQLEEEIRDLVSRFKETVKKYEKTKPNKVLETRVKNMYTAMAVKDRQQNQLKGKIYGLQQEMLHDIVKSADVVSFYSFYKRVQGCFETDMIIPRRFVQLV